MKILLTGKDGQLGFALRRALAPLGAVHAVGRRDCELSDARALRAVVASVQPDVIVNAAAYTAVDRAESEAELAWAINATAPQVLAEEAARTGALLLHYSTDYVFDGTADRPYTETDTVNPQSSYGRSKRAGEEAVLASAAPHLVLRTSWVLGTHGGNFARTMLKLAGERDELRVVSDQIGAPTTADLIADVTAHLLRQWHTGQRSTFPSGLYHLTASGHTSWHGYATHVIERARAVGWPVRVAPDRVLSIPTSAYPTPAQRPANSRLDTTRLQATFGLALPPWQDGVDQVLTQWLSAPQRPQV